VKERGRERKGKGRKEEERGLFFLQITHEMLTAQISSIVSSWQYTVLPLCYYSLTHTLSLSLTLLSLSLLSQSQTQYFPFFIPSFSPNSVTITSSMCCLFITHMDWPMHS
jgi:hypothetical protein